MKVRLIEDRGFLDFSPCNFGREACAPSHRFGPRIRNEYLIHFIISGKGKFISERGVYELSAGDAFLIKPGEVNNYEADFEHPWEYMWLGFRGNLAQSFQLLEDTFKYEEWIIRELEYAMQIDLGCEALLAGCCFKLYASLVGASAREDYPKKVVNYIDAHYMENVTISKIAESLSLDRKYLARIFKEKEGTSMQAYLIKKRLQEAKKLLSEGYAVKEAAFMVGYRDQFGFSRAFKKCYGVSPENFKV